MLEKAGGTLWYACPYEGFEANEHVVYMHACPNQHLVPLLGLCRAALRRQRLPARLELHLGLGDQPCRPRPDRRRRRQGAGRALSAARRGRRVAADRRDRGDAAGLRAQQSDRPVLLRLHRGLCRARRARSAFPAGALPGPVLQSHRMRAAGDRRSRQRPSLGRAVFPTTRRRRRPPAALPGSSLEAAAYASVRVLGRNPGRQSRGALDRPSQGLLRRDVPDAVRRHRHRPADPARDLAGRDRPHRGRRVQDGEPQQGRRARSLSVALRPRRDLRPPAPARSCHEPGLAHPQSRRRQGVRAAPPAPDGAGDHAPALGDRPRT